MCNTALDVLSKRLFEMYFQINRAMDGYYYTVDVMKTVYLQGIKK